MRWLLVMRPMPRALDYDQTRARLAAHPFAIPFKRRIVGRAVDHESRDCHARQRVAPVEVTERSEERVEIDAHALR